MTEVEGRERDDYWKSDEYLKRNAAGAHSNSNVILSELEELKSELREITTELDKHNRYLWALGFGILLLMLQLWLRG